VARRPARRHCRHRRQRRGLATFSLDVTLGRQLGLIVFHLLATVVVIAVVRQQLGSRAQ
jgi:hypothetical protein